MSDTERICIETEQTVSKCCRGEWMLAGGRKVCRECGEECEVVGVKA